MKKLVLLLLVFTGVPAFAAGKTVVLDVPTMNCAACPITVKKALQKVEGVSGVEVRYDANAKQATVTFDDEITTVDQLIGATTNAGYPSTINQPQP